MNGKFTYRLIFRGKNWSPDDTTSTLYLVVPSNRKNKMASFKFRTRKIAKSSRLLADVVDLDWLCYGKDSLSAQEISVLLDGGYYCEIAESNKKVIGAIIYNISSNDVRIATVCVHPDHERLGVGSKLLANVSCKMGRNHSGCHIQVPESVIQNCEFLTKNGFMPIRNGSSSRNGKTYFLFSLLNPFFAEVQLVTKSNEV